ncbi:unnamed protein product [Chrysoparadoxa australica]
MRGLLGALGLVPLVTGFIARPSIVCRRSLPHNGACAASRPQHTALSMLVEPSGKDSFQELEADAETNPVRSVLAKTSPQFAGVVFNGLIPVGAAVAALAVPGGRVVSAVAGAVGGVAGGIARAQLSAQNKATAPAAVGRLLELKGIGEVPPELILAELQGYGVEGAEAEEVLVLVYKKYLLAMCKSSATKTAEIKELSELRESLGLDGEMLGNAHYEACLAVYKERVLFTPTEELEDEYSPDRRALDKFLFLSDRMFEVCDTEEAYQYEMGRIRKVFDLSQQEVKSRCQAIARPFYSKALDSVSNKLESVKADALVRARNTLGIPDDTAHEMHLAAYQAEVKKIVGESEEITDESAQRLESMKSVLGLNDDEATHMTELITIPIYEHLVSEALESSLGGEEETAATAKMLGKLAIMQSKLRLSPVSANNVLKEVVGSSAAMHLVSATKFIRVSNTKKALEATKELLQFVAAATTMVSKAMALGDGVDPVSAIFGRSMVENPREGERLYRLYLSSALEDGNLDAEEKHNLSILARLMSVSPAQVSVAYSESCGPLLKQQLETAIEANTFTDNEKTALASFVSNLGIPDDLFKQQIKDAYWEKLRDYSANGAILTESEKTSLDNLQAYLAIDQEVVDGLHQLVCSPQYRKSVVESMGSTGVIPQEFKEGLEKLRVRLGLTPKVAQDLFFEAGKLKMKPMLSQIFYEFERSVMSKEQLAQKRGRDVGDDVGIGGSDAGELGIASSAAVTSDVLNLIDFITDNEMMVEKEDGSLEFPVTAEGMATPEMSTKLYQQFVVSGFTVEGEEAKRYEGAQPKLAGVLGLEPDVVKKIHAEIGTTVLQQFLTSQLREKTSIGPQEIAFLANLNSKLNMPESDFENLVSSLKVSIIRNQAEMLSTTSKLTADLCRTIRERANNIGVDLAKDARVDIKQRKKMFELESLALIEGGTGDESDIAEISEQLGLGADEAQDLMETLIDEKAKAILGGAVVDAMGGREGRVVKSIEQLLKYARLAGGIEVNYDMNDEQKAAVFNTYSAAKAGGSEESEEQVAADTELLRQALRYKQPAQV